MLCLWPATASCAIVLSQNQFPELNPHSLSSFIQFYYAGFTYWALLEMLSHSLHTNHLHTSTNYLAANYFTIYRKGWLACLKPDMDSAVGVHPTQLWFIHNSVMMGFPVDGVLVSVGSLWLLNYVNLLGV